MSQQPEVKAGNTTSEFKLSWVTMVINLVVLVAGAIATQLSDSPWGAIAAAVVAAGNSWKAHSYNQGRSSIKTAAARGPTFIQSK